VDAEKNLKRLPTFKSWQPFSLPVSLRLLKELRNFLKALITKKK